MSDTRKVFGIAGWKNSGKTTLITALISELTERGLKVSSIKHSHHSFDIDHEGRDSYRHRQSGAHEVLISSSKRFALMHEHAPNDEEPSLDALLTKMANVDVILVEGFKSSPIPKIEILRSDQHNKDRSQMKNVVAIVSDKPDAHSLPQFTPDQINEIANFILSYPSAFRV